MNYILDTNIITAFIKHNQHVRNMLNMVKEDGKDVFLSAMSYYEIKRGLLAVQASRKLEIFESFSEEYDILWLDSYDILDCASKIYADLKRSGKIIQDADILIAATAMVHHLIVVTDDPDFSRISGITIENWIEREHQMEQVNLPM